MTRKGAEKPESRLPGLRVLPPMPESPDEDALVLLRARDARGFDLAYARYGQRIFGFLVRLSRSRAVAEDLFQHTFLRLAERGPSLFPGSDLRAWLFSVARNAFHSHARAERVASRAESADFPSAGVAEPDGGLLRGDLERALSALNHDDRELLLLVGVEGMGQTDVARLLGVGQVALRQRLSRARARLAAALDGASGVVAESRPKR